jgi:hypothetical protein
MDQIPNEMHRLNKVLEILGEAEKDRLERESTSGKLRT